jgi:ABC-type multidrug transport system fused ATPase/permease subunit
MRALKNVLSQDAAYFDHSENSGAKLIQRIGADSISIKVSNLSDSIIFLFFSAATDVRAYNVLNNSICSVIQIIMALAFCWEVALVGLSLYTLLLIALWFLTGQLRTAMQKLNEIDDSPKASCFSGTIFCIRRELCTKIYCYMF